MRILRFLGWSVALTVGMLFVTVMVSLIMGALIETVGAVNCFYGIVGMAFLFAMLFVAWQMSE